MFREIELGDTTPRQPANKGPLRHPDGSINFEAYREIAGRARKAAIASSVSDTMRVLSAALSQVAGVLAGKATPAARHTP